MYFAPETGVLSRYPCKGIMMIEETLGVSTFAYKALRVESRSRNLGWGSDDHHSEKSWNPTISTEYHVMDDRKDWQDYCYWTEWVMRFNLAICHMWILCFGLAYLNARWVKYGVDLSYWDPSPPPALVEIYNYSSHSVDRVP